MFLRSMDINDTIPKSWCQEHVFIFVMSAVLEIKLSERGAFLGYSAISALNIASRDGLSLGRDYKNIRLTCTLPQPSHISCVPALCLFEKDAPLRFRQRHIPALRSGPDAKTAAYIRAVATQRERTGKAEHLSRAARRTPG